MGIQNYDWPSSKIIWAGTSGTGKTTHFWKQFQKEKARVKFIYDHKAGEFSRRYKITPVFDADGIIEATAKGGIVCFDPMYEFAGEPEKGFEFFCELVFAMSEKIKGRKLVGCDELQRLVGTNAKPKPLLTMCDVGRTYQIDCRFIASSTSTIHNLVRNQFTECFLFRHGDKNTTDWPEANGFNADELMALKNGEYVWRNLNSGETRKGGEAFQPHAAGA